MKASLRILVSVSIVTLLSGLVNSQSSATNKSETVAVSGNATNSSVSPVPQQTQDLLNSSTSLPTEPPSPNTTTSTSTSTTTTTTIPTSTTTTPSTTTAEPTTSTQSTTSPSTSEPTTTKTQATTTTTTTTTTKPPPATGGRRFDAPSFFGGIILAFGLLAICYVAFKFYRSRTEHNYHSLQETVHM